MLNGANALAWEYPWWVVNSPWLIGYLPFFLVSFWVHDIENLRQKIITVGVILGVDLASLILFAGVLKWILIGDVLDEYFEIPSGTQKLLGDAIHPLEQAAGFSPV